MTELNAWAPRMLQQMRTLPQLVDVSSDQQDKGLQASVVIDRSTASRLGITPQLIDDTLYDAFGQRQVSITYTLLNQYHVVMEVEPSFWQRPETLQDIYVRSPTGAMVPLSAFARFERTSTSLAVNHQSQFPSVTISFNLAPGVSLGEAVKAVESATVQMGLPRKYPGQFHGDGPGLPGLSGQRTDSDPGRARHRLHRARRALRELHPSRSPSSPPSPRQAWERFSRYSSFARNSVSLP